MIPSLTDNSTQEACTTHCGQVLSVIGEHHVVILQRALYHIGARESPVKLAVRLIERRIRILRSTKRLTYVAEDVLACTPTSLFRCIQVLAEGRPIALSAFKVPMHRSPLPLFG